MDAPEFLSVSPGKKIPAIEHGELRLRESAAITDYLFRLAGRVPDSPQIAAQIEQWSCFTLMEIDATALYVLRRHRDLPNLYGEAPAACTSAEEYYERQMAVVAAALDDGREYLVGDELTKAHIILVSCIDWARMYKLSVPQSALNYRERLNARPAYQAAFAVNYPGP